MTAYNHLYPLVKQLFLIVSRPARLLECLVSWPVLVLNFLITEFPLGINGLIFTHFSSIL